MDHSAAVPVAAVADRQGAPRGRRAIDVIVPCYNYGRYLGQCVGSVLDQPRCDVRVLIIDDASTDDSATFARALAASSERVEFRAHTANRGHIATYNEGIDWVAGDYMLLLSADDALAPGALGRAIDVMERHPGCAAVFGRAIRFEDGEEPDLKSKTEVESSGDLARAEVTRGLDFIKGLCEHPTNPIDTATAVVRGPLQKRVGGYLPELPHSGDLEMWLRLATYGDIGFVDTVQAFTRLHARNMRRAYMAERMMGDFDQRRLALRMYFDAHSAALPEALPQMGQLRALASRRLATQVVWAAAVSFEDGTLAEVRRLTELARTIWPEIDRTPEWRRLWLKRRLGQRIWRGIDRVRRGFEGGIKPAVSTAG